MPQSKPLILLTFANDRRIVGAYLRNLPEENRQIREALAPAKKEGWCEVEHLPNVTFEEVINAFQNREYRDRIAVFHFGGHAGSYQLMLEDHQGRPVEAAAPALAEFLSQQQGLKLVFLNGCSTEQQVHDLLSAGVPAIIATSQNIDDGVAMHFAARFYRSLAGGSGLERAYKEAAAAVKLEKGEHPRKAYLTEAEAEERWPWQIHFHPAAPGIAEWNLPAAAPAAKAHPPKKWWERWQTRLAFAAALLTLLSLALDMPEKVTKLWEQLIGRPAVTTPLKGIVTNTRGGPVEGAVVKINLLPGDSLLTTSSGSFTFKAVPGNPGDAVRIYVSAPGYRSRNEFKVLSKPADIVLEDKLPGRK